MILINILIFFITKIIKEICSDGSLNGIYHDKYDTTYGEIMCNSIDNIFDNIKPIKNDVRMI